MRDRPDGQVELKCHPTVEAHIFATTGSLSVLDFAHKVQPPVHLVHATTGHFEKSFFEPLTSLFPNGSFSQIEGGHMLPLEVPDKVLAFLASIT